MENAKRRLRVEVAYARPDVQTVLALDVPEGATVEEAIQESGILQRYPEIDLTRNKVGVFGRLTRLDTALRAGDRVEIYRPLIADPKEVRRARAAKGEAMGKAGDKTGTEDRGAKRDDGEADGD